MADIPDGVDYQTAQAAVAWVIAKIAFEVGSGAVTADEAVEKLLALYNKALYSITHPAKPN